VEFKILVPNFQGHQTYLMLCTLEATAQIRSGGRGLFLTAFRGLHAKGVIVARTCGNVYNKQDPSLAWYYSTTKYEKLRMDIKFSLPK
jgi:hypothetical protein